MLYFIGDTHFTHPNILKYEPRRQDILGKTIEEHDVNLIQRINFRVKPEDTLIIVGDFGFGPTKILKEILDQIHGTKILVLGNHDKNSFNSYLTMGFSWVCYETKIKIAREYVRITHHPYRKPWFKVFFPWQYKERDRRKRPMDYGHFLIHGHIHSGGYGGRGAWKVKNRQINVGVDVWDYYPVALFEIANLIGKVKGC